MQNQNTDKKSAPSKRKKIFSKINVTLFIFIVLNVILMALFYFALKNKLQDKKILGSGKIWNIVHKCSNEHPESCDKSCNANGDCYPSCTRDCGCLKSGEVCDDDENTIQCEVAPFSCKCENSTCEIVEYKKEETKIPDQAINIIGNYIDETTSMCS